MYYNPLQCNSSTECPNHSSLGAKPSRGTMEEAFRKLSIQYANTLLAFTELYLETVKEDKDEQYLLDFCDKLNQLSVTY